MIRQPIITIVGHVDSGKTSLLDKIRGTNVTLKEAGRITQHIGATEVSITAIKNVSSGLIEKFKFDLKIPGLLFIDTPGHEAFTNLRKRGAGIADLMVLIVDINAGLQPQTIESIQIIKETKTPFIIVLNKIDRLRGWQDSKEKSFLKALTFQQEQIKQELDDKVYELVGKMYEQGFQSERFDRVQDFTKEIAIIPLSAETGEGIAEMLLFLGAISQKFLEEKLEIEVKGAGKGTVLDCKEEKGLGKTIDLILTNGTIKLRDEILFTTNAGIEKSRVKALLKPKPMDEISMPREIFQNFIEVSAACGVKIVAPGLEKVVPGTRVEVIVNETEQRKELEKEFKNIEVESEILGPIIKADTLGSVEALTRLLEEKELKPRKKGVGDVSLKDLKEIEAVKAKDPLKGVIFAFNVKLSPELEKEVEKKNIKVFKGNVVYKLIEAFEEWKALQLDEKRQKIFKELCLPVRIKLLRNHVFHNTKPLIVGVKILEGNLKIGIQLMKDFKIIGKVKAIQSEGKNIQKADKGMEVAVSIEGATINKDLIEEDELTGCIPKKHLRELSENLDYFGEEEKKIILELKKLEKKEESE
ncbi:MAG: translation initiation factor IF-2 [archaeon]